MRRLGIVIMIIGAVLIAGALALFAHNRWVNYQAGISVAEIQGSLEAALAEGDQQIDTDGNASMAGSGAADDTMPTVEIDGYDYIGTLSISKLGLELPIMDQWSYEGMKIAPGRYTGSVWTDDMIICGHNYERHFGHLKDLEAGDIVTFTDVNGTSFDYEVVEVETLQPTAVEDMISGDWSLTLFTCTTGGEARFTVRCMRQEG